MTSSRAFLLQQLASAPVVHALQGKHHAHEHAAFILSRVHDLREHLKALGSNLLIRVGMPEAVLPRLVQEIQAASSCPVRVYCHEEFAEQDLQVCMPC